MALLFGESEQERNNRLYAETFKRAREGIWLDDLAEGLPQITCCEQEERIRRAAYRDGVRQRGEDARRERNSSSDSEESESPQASEEITTSSDGCCGSGGGGYSSSSSVGSSSDIVKAVVCIVVLALIVVRSLQSNQRGHVYSQESQLQQVECSHPYRSQSVAWSEGSCQANVRTADYVVTAITVGAAESGQPKETLELRIEPWQSEAMELVQRRPDASAWVDGDLVRFSFRGISGWLRQAGGGALTASVEGKRSFVRTSPDHAQLVDDVLTVINERWWMARSSGKAPAAESLVVSPPAGAPTLPKPETMVMTEESKQEIASLIQHRPDASAWVDGDVVRYSFRGITGWFRENANGSLTGCVEGERSFVRTASSHAQLVDDVLTVINERWWSSKQSH